MRTWLFETLKSHSFWASEKASNHFSITEAWPHFIWEGEDSPTTLQPEKNRKTSKRQGRKEKAFQTEQEWAREPQQLRTKGNTN